MRLRKIAYALFIIATICLFTSCKKECKHQSIEWVIDKQATCTEEGNSKYWKCTTCGKYFSDVYGNHGITLESTVIPATGHTIVIDKAVEPTYTSTGLTEGSHCSVCGTVLKKQEEIPALPTPFNPDAIMIPI